MRREKRGRLSSLPPSVTRVVIYASREFRSTEKKKRDAARRLSLFLIFEFFFYPSCYRSEVASWLSTQNTLQRMATDMTEYTR